MGEIVGRELELERVSGLEAGALVLEGEPGIGKTTLWEAGIDGARSRGVRALVARPNGAEAQLSFAALIDLCEGIDAGALPAPQRDALEVALLRRSPAGAPPEPHAIGLGLRAVLSAHAPLLVAIDDIQWLDAPSAQALAFAARRLEGEPVTFLLARRPGEPSRLEQVLERRRLERVEIGPFGVRETRRLLLERLGLRVDLPLLRRIVDATLGNPLFALEVGRLLAARGLPEAGEELPVPVSVEDLLGTRVAALPAPERRLLLAVALSADLHVDELRAVGDGVYDALDAGLLLADGDRVRASHPLLAAAARTQARPGEQRALHAVLARTVREPEQRALHLALAAERPDAALAAEIAAAAANAAARGARPEAVALAEQALRLTPPDDGRRGERLLRLGEALEVAGERLRLSDLLLGAIDTLAPGEQRVRAWLLLADSGIVTRDENAARVERALAEAGDDPALRARVLAFKALSTAAEGVERIAEAERWALEALPELDAMRALGWARALRGLELDGLAARFRDAAGPGAQLVDAPEPVAALRSSWRGELAAARSATTAFLADAAERGEEVSYAWLRLNLTELELRAGEWDAAERLLDEWAESDAGQLLITPTYQRCRALLAVGRGDAEDARRWGRTALAEAETRDYRWQVLESRRALGSAALLAGDPDEAAEQLRWVWGYCAREGIDEPGAFPVAPDLVEALVELGELDEARAVTRRLAEPGEAHPWAWLTACRSAAVISLAVGDDPASAAVLTEVAAEYARRGLRFDAARAFLALGRGQRRQRQWRAAREALGEAAERFDALGSPGWAALTRAEIARVGGRKPRAEGELTRTEAQVAQLAAAGRTNKEIAHALFVTVHTVEAHLSSTYAKLGVRSRAQLSQRLPAP
ncbi:LuxR C-terminal-related transcriptional regulator [Solirubrobacter ginsenosidimutans]|uniref:LuxR C-terminal-related transcriptional regulator n=1 Tax=Solirubrobacter ginsenosidimutans TaxID=490573 RepID=A0A9X3S8I0_9ACTN|nr:LuxR family transcriptional regulator [Solirubrobacter ginsenosidimutans]MDA0167011.1 LuxR C-terminal-related transcriptional regulator [Solirubrobacter ginsenosidimutans]